MANKQNNQKKPSVGYTAEEFVANLNIELACFGISVDLPERDPSTTKEPDTYGVTFHKPKKG